MYAELAEKGGFGNRCQPLCVCETLRRDVVNSRARPINDQRCHAGNVNFNETRSNRTRAGVRQ